MFQMDQDIIDQPAQRKFYSRTVVLPGDRLSDDELRPGIGTFRGEDGIYSSRLGIRNVKANFMNVIPLAGRYNPRQDDSVIGTIVDMNPMIWIVEITAPYRAQLHINDVPWDVSFGETGKFLRVGDTILARVDMVDETKKIILSMKGQGLRKLTGGKLVQVSASKVPRIIGKSGSMISMLKGRSGCYVFVGQNGLIWLDGNEKNMQIVSRAIGMIQSHSHKKGLTQTVETFLLENTEPKDDSTDRYLTKNTTEIDGATDNDNN